MRIENLAYQHKLNTKQYYSLSPDWNRHPKDLIPSMQSLIQNGLDVLRNNDDREVRFSFRMPSGTHVLPLFQKELFYSLVHLHNAESDTTTFIHPFTLMIFDPCLGNLRAHIEPFKMVRGEDVTQHELAHFFRIQERRKTDAKGVIEFNLYWNKEKGVKVLMSGGQVIPDEILNSEDETYMLSGPLYPSQSDFNRIRFLDGKDRGIHIERNPLSSDRAQGILYHEWRKIRQDKIDFAVWDELVEKRIL